MSDLLMESSAMTHPGSVRSRNEDALLACDVAGFWVVADGAGGHGAGDVASAAIVAALADIPPGLGAAALLAQVRLRLSTVHADLQRQAAPGGLIASTVVVMLARDGHYACLWAGDSRAYRLRHGALCRVTRDHSLVQELVDQGTLTEAEAERHPHANVITRAVGGDGPLELDKVADRLAPGDCYLLCSDGLFKALPEAEIATLLAGEATAAALIEAALARTARDNVTAVVIRCAADDDMTMRLPPAGAEAGAETGEAPG
ncbi:protein phosphatase 2C domain-containing protein [Roseomonas sp. NAR14]|uniref:Protein phosphatase 2C domain-containing protein n=1 Tax=Roseomonas acroporae TaxID=2937791 RepID=A0A9X1Y8N7_9PROT|nr:protein phosphatase 2C domain-containing protein [Roseomonas acroporae]MCK8785137.1 protein phosphatase 2C domain-containing protein [Roseomonas acroporae]